jgi:hypothetical protein
MNVIVVRLTVGGDRSPNFGMGSPGGPIFKGPGCGDQALDWSSTGLASDDDDPSRMGAPDSPQKMRRSVLTPAPMPLK